MRMFYLIPQVFIILSLGGIVFIFLRKIIKIEFKAQDADKPAPEKISILKAYKPNAQKLLKKFCLKAKNCFEKISLFLSKIWRTVQNILKRIGRKLEALLKTWFEKFKQKKQAYQIKKEKKAEYAKETKEKKSGIEAMILEKKYINKIAKHPKDIKSYQGLGLLYIEQKNFKNAKECFEYILKLEPGNQEAKKSLETINKPE